MISFLVFLIIVALMIVLIVLSTILGFFQRIFSLGKTSRIKKTPPSAKRSKIFKADEGEYVDYE